MTNYGWTNEAGEPIMDGAAWRFEQQLDADYAEQRYLDDDDFFGDYDEPECEDDHECNDCNGPGGIWDREGNFTPHPGQTWTCAWCSRSCPPDAHTD